MAAPDPITMPFTVLVSGAEQARYWFGALTADANRQNAPLIVPSEWAHLPTGDYTIRGLESLILIERKSLSDLFGTLGSAERRDRFRREHERLSRVDFAAIVIEANLDQVLLAPPPESRLNPKTVFRTMVSWTHKYGVHWIFASDRHLAEITTFRILQKYWETHFATDSTARPTSRKRRAHSAAGNADTPDTAGTIGSAQSRGSAPASTIAESAAPGAIAHPSGPRNDVDREAPF